MGYAVGIALALFVSLFARLTGLDRDRAFYPTIAIVIALLYVLFAVMGASSHALLVDSIPMAAFVLLAVLGFKLNLWLVVACLAGHGIFDLFHPHVIDNPGVPEWWPSFCMTYDLVAAAFLAGLLLRAKIAVRVASR
ncbi:MAG TPA: hypothetical protein VM692_06000 [Gammaproteobacteria bacterium]|nr:hypothetical protein [Gammaproteobacteria bacterium]